MFEEAVNVTGEVAFDSFVSLGSPPPHVASTPVQAGRSDSRHADEGGRVGRTLEQDDVPAFDAWRGLRWVGAAPTLSDLSPRSEFADSAFFVAEDELQEGDLLACFRSLLDMYGIWTVDFQYRY